MIRIPAGSTTAGGGGGATTLNAITAATGAVTIASGNNTGIVWNWANTTDSTLAFTIGETTAATNGTLDVNGIPNQVLFELDTLAASTMSPFRVKSRGSVVVAVSPSAPQLLFPVGTAVNPNLAFAGQVGDGIYFSAPGEMDIAIAGTQRFIFQAGAFSTPDGTAAAPSVRSAGGAHGLFWGSTVVGVSTGGIENSRFAAGVFQHSKSTADAVSYAHNFRKSRGTVAIPTVITTGDVVMTLSAAPYLGATNTYRETGRIEITSTGTISDATTGVGSILTLYGKTQGTDATVQPTLIITNGSTATIKFAGTGMFTANATTACALTAVGPAGANTTVQTWFTVTDSGGTVRYIPCF